MSYEAYELWYEYLKRTNPTTWSVDVRKDFGGVLLSSCDDWFREVQFDLFAIYGMQFDKLPVRVMRDPKGAANVNFDTHLVLIIDLSRPVSFLMPRIQSKIEIELSEEGKAGRPKWKQSLAKYPFARRPDPEALRICLDVHDAKRDHPDWTLWKIGSYIQTLHPILLEQKLKNTDTDAERTAKQKVLTATMGRYLARAEKIKAGVVNGIFPAA
jgi:hypothetical protein